MEVSANQITYAESFLMVSRAEAGDGELSGRFIHSMTGGNIENVTYELRKGWDNVIGETVKEGVSADGTYTLTVPAGNYTLNASNEDFVSAHINVVVQANACSERDVTMSPTNISAGDEGLLQIVLTWGETPRDLDSHLLGPADENGDDYFHVYYRDKNAYSEDGDVIANLDLDDTSSYGPETTTIYNLAGPGIGLDEILAQRHRLLRGMDGALDGGKGQHISGKAQAVLRSAAGADELSVVGAVPTVARDFLVYPLDCPRWSRQSHPSASECSSCLSAQHQKK